MLRLHTNRVGKLIFLVPVTTMLEILVVKHAMQKKEGMFLEASHSLAVKLLLMTTKPPISKIRAKTIILSKVETSPRVKNLT